MCVGYLRTMCECVWYIPIYLFANRLTTCDRISRALFSFPFLSIFFVCGLLLSISRCKKFADRFIVHAVPYPISFLAVSLLCRPSDRTSNNSILFLAYIWRDIFCLLVATTTKKGTCVYGLGNNTIYEQVANVPFVRENYM